MLAEAVSRRVPIPSQHVPTFQSKLGQTYLVKNISSKKLGSDTASQVLNTLATKTALDGSIVTMRLGVAFFQERQPCFLGMLALRKVQRVAVGLKDAPVSLLRVSVFQLIKRDAIGFQIVIIRLGKIKLKTS